MRAVITGVGAVSAFGSGVQTLFDGCCSGRSAIGDVRSFDATTFPVRVAAEVPPEVVLAGELPQWKRDRKVGFALTAAAEAIAHAKIDPSILRDAVLSLALGLETALLEDFVLSEGAIDFDAELQRSRAHAFPRLRVPADLAARALREKYAIGGQEYLHMSACAAGADALACASSLIRRGRAELVLCGGTDSMVNPLGLGGMARLGATSPRHESDACRPFDAKRDGLAMGEGAAIFVVESERSALARGAEPLAVVSGWGSSQDAYKATAPRPDGSGAVAAMRAALRSAGMSPADVDYLNAHGTGTLLNDAVEAAAIQEVFGEVLPAVSSIKGAIGHAMASAGALELAVCVTALKRGTVPGTTGLAKVDAAIPIPILPPGAHHISLRSILSNSFGFGGHNSSVIVEAYR